MTQNSGTTRTYSGKSGSSPVELIVDSSTGLVSVDIGGASAPYVTVSTKDSKGHAADAVNNAEISEGGGILRVEVPLIDGGGNVSIGNSFVQIGNYGVIGRGDVIINGRNVSGGVRVSPIIVQVSLPAGSTVTAKTMSADVAVTGTAHSLTAETMSGDVRADSVAYARVKTMSGDIEVAGVTNRTSLSTMSGDIDVTAAPGTDPDIDASTMSGDVTSHRRTRVNASTMSGRVRNR